MSEKQTRKILRIGIIQGGKIIEERLLRKREPVTVGESHKNTFVIPTSGLPSRFPLFELRGDKYYLTFADWMDGRVSLATGVGDLGTIKQKEAKKAGLVDYVDPNAPKEVRKKVPVFQVALTDKSRGKILLGDITLLFQFVTPPPLPTKPHLPAIIQGGWVKGIDWAYSTILLISFILHSGIVYWCQIAGPLPTMSIDQIPDRWAQFIRPPVIRQPPVVKKGDGEKGDKGGEKKKKKKKAGPKKKGKGKKKGGPKKDLTPEEKARRAALRREKLRRRMARTGVLALLGAKGTGDSGTTVRNVLAGGSHYTSKLDDAMKGMRGVTVAGSGVVSRGSRRGGGSARGLSIKESLRGPAGGGGGGGGGGVDRKGRKGAKVKSNFKMEKLEVDGQMNQSKLYRLISRKRSAFKFCYERQLKRTPDLRGKISLRITIALNGRVSEVEVENNDLNKSVASCIIALVRRWRFPKPEGDAVTVVLPFIFSPSG